MPEKLRAKCQRLNYKISLSDLLVRVCTGLKAPYPVLTDIFNHLESVDQPAHNYTAADELTIDKYANWISLITKEFQKACPGVTRKIASSHGAAGAALSVRANVD
jgi:hypothetical protein